MDSANDVMVSGASIKEVFQHCRKDKEKANYQEAPHPLMLLRSESNLELLPAEATEVTIRDELEMLPLNRFTVNDRANLAKGRKSKKKKSKP